MLDVTYSYYEEDNKFEEKQAFIYNQAIKGYGGEETTAEAIKKRNIDDGPEPYGARYASTSDGTPLAYIQHRVYHLAHFLSIWIGYPWCIKHCPIEIQHELFKDMLAYIKSKYPHYPINLGYLDDRFTKMHQFAQTYGFIEKYKKIHYLFDLESLAKIDHTDLPIKKLTPDDLSGLLDLAEHDKILDKVYLNGKEVKTYLEQEIIPAKHSVTIYDKDQYVAAASINTANLPNQLNFNFGLIKPGYEQVFRTLLAKISQELISELDKDNLPPMHIVVRNDQDYIHTIAKEIGAPVIKKRTLYVLY